MPEMTRTSNSIDLMERIVALCKRRGFIFPSSEIYGGLNGFWDYGPLGAELKRNVKEAWWQDTVHLREDVVGLDASIIMHPKIWKASGHVDTFSDPMVDCLLTRKRFRADQIEPRDGTVLAYSGARDNTSGATCHEAFSVMLPAGKSEDYARKIARQFYASRGVNEPELLEESMFGVEASTSYNPDNGALLTPPRQFNLMFKTTVGPVEDDENTAYLRPETAQAIFVQFRNVLDTSRLKIPFGIAQIGKAFRNEINPRNFTFRSREFEQMEIEFFIRPDEVVAQTEGRVDEDGQGDPRPDWGWRAWHRYWLRERRRWYASVGLAQEDLEEYWQGRDELAHYARATVDLLFRFPFGWQELEGIAARGDFDLTQHQNYSGKPLDYFDEVAKQRYVPHVIEPSAGVDRLVLAIICSAYDEEPVADTEDGAGEIRTVLRLHPRVAPYKCAVFPLLKNKPELVGKAREIFCMLRGQFTCYYDESGAIGRRYRRQDEVGTPFCITVDFETIEGRKNGGQRDTVTVRDRDTMRQERVSIQELASYISEKMSVMPQRSSLRL